MRLPFLTPKRKHPVRHGDAVAGEQTPDARDLMHWVDGHVPPGSALDARIRRYLEAHPEGAAKVEDWRRQKAAIRAMYEPVLAEPVPERLQPEHLRAQRRQRWQRARRWALPAAVVPVLVSVLWLSPGEQPDPLERFAEEVVRFGGSQGDGRRAGADAVGTQPVATVPAAAAPDLQLAGFQAESTEVLRLEDGRKVLRVRYRNGEGTKLALFASPEAPADADRVARLTRAGQQVVYWRSGGRMFALTADSVDGQKLQELAVASLRGDTRQPMTAEGGPDPALAGDDESLATMALPESDEVPVPSATVQDERAIRLEQDPLSPPVQEP